MNQSERRQFLIRTLLQERTAYQHIPVPSGDEEQKELLRALMNVRVPGGVSDEFLRVEDAYLQEETRQKGITELDMLIPIRKGIFLWQGDITALRCDAIVNAANSGMTGCYIPNHRCIDNCIHTFSGVRLRLACVETMRRQGHAEPTGQAKITSAYNLPSRFILHTVGPVIAGRLTRRDCELLVSCYRSCLELAAENQLETVAFCCISTGEFHFSNDQAAEIAIASVRKFMKTETSVKKVIFNVFKDLDKEIYERLLRAD